MSVRRHKFQFGINIEGFHFLLFLKQILSIGFQPVQLFFRIGKAGKQYEQHRINENRQGWTTRTGAAPTP